MFRYRAATPAGEVVSGEMEAPDAQAVVRRLQTEGNVPIRAEPIAAATPRRRARPLLTERRNVTRRDVEMLTVEIATLLESGLTLDRALSIMTELAPHGAVRTLLDAIHTEVRGGASLSAALTRHGHLFPRFYISIVKAGEASGDLHAALARLAEFMERARALREAMVSAMLYPVILVCVAVGSIAVILGMVVPSITEMFVDAGQTLPASTRVVVAAGELVQRFWWVGVLAIVAARYGGRRLLARPEHRLRWDRWLLDLPLAGELLAKLEAARFTRALGTLLANGVTMLEALRIATEVVGNRHVAAGLAEVAGEVKGGQGLARPLVKVGVFPRLAGHLVRIGEEAGSLETMLLRLADIYDAEVQSTVRRAVTLLGPILILLIGLLIAGLILSILTALLSVNELAF